MDIAAWLRGLGLDRYAQEFRDNEIDAKLLPTLTAEDLKDLGVSIVGHRRKLLNAIAALAECPVADRRGLSADDTIMEHDLTADGMFADGDRRQVTVLFADIAGYTKLSRELDAEKIHTFLGQFFGVVDGIVTFYGGRVDKHIGDCVMAVFGAPVAHGNDPERAIHAALEIQDRAPALSSELGRSVGVHIGIACGQVVASSTGSDNHVEYTVTGESVNLASRLTDKAEIAQTLISDAVRELLPDQLDCEEVAPLWVKGIDGPVKAWLLRGWRQAIPTQRQNLVGRTAELSQFDAALTACRATRCGQVIYLRGEAGIGKTRLVEEFQVRGEKAGFACHAGLVLDFGTGTGRDALRLIVRSLLGVPSEADDSTTESVIDRTLAYGLLDEDDRVFLNDLLDVPQPPELQALFDAMDNPSRNRGKSKTIANLAQRLARKHSLMLIVEDLHWADRLTLQHLARIAETVKDYPCLLVLTSRLDGDPLDRSWRSEFGNSSLMTIDLGPLRRQDAEAFAESFVDRSANLTKRCIERAAGNPLFLEQLLRYAGDETTTSIPDSIQILVQSCLDRLEPIDKAALQAASILGQSFSLEALRYLIKRSDYNCDALTARFHVRPRAEGFLFAHALVRDGVYDSLLRARHRELHRRAAQWFEERDCVLHAEHLDRAEDAKAPEAYLNAARLQAGSYRYNLALALVERGLELVSGGLVAFELTCTRGDLLRELGSADDSITSFEGARQLADDLTQECRALIGIAAGMRVVGRFEDALSTLDQAEAAAREELNKRDMAEIHYTRGNVYFPLGQIDGCLEQHQTAQYLAREANATDLEARALGGLADANYMRGRMLTAYDHFRRCVDLAQERGLGAVAIANWPMIGCVRRYRNELSEAWDDSLVAIDKSIRVGNQRAEIIARQNAWLLREMARFTEARPHFERALELGRAIGARLFEPLNLTELAFIDAAEGNFESASALIEEAWSESQNNRPTFLGPWVLGVRARITTSEEVREESLRHAELLLAEGSVSHNYYFFYSDGIDAVLRIGDWERAERYASALEFYTRDEPNPWSNLHITRARLLAAYGRGRRDKSLREQIAQLADEARRAEHHLVLATIERALTSECRSGGSNDDRH